MQFDEATKTKAIQAVERNLAIFHQLMKGLSIESQILYRWSLASTLQDLIDSMLGNLADLADDEKAAGEQQQTAPVAATQAPAVSAVPAVPARAESQARSRITVPDAIRAMLAGNATGLLPREILQRLREDRPDVDEAAVHSALHSMRKRGELAREGFHKNYRYRLIPRTSATIDFGTNESPGGATH